MESKTARDVVEGLASEDRAALEQALSTVRDLMTTELVTLRPNQTVGDAINLFAARQFRHLLVTDAGALVGVVSDRDVLRWLARNPGAVDTPVSSVMTRRAICLPPDSPLSEAIRTIIHNRINCLPVVTKEGILQGVLTTTDLLRALFAMQYWLERRAAGVAK
jgi:acetoin utilization protein AcuB